MSGGDLSGSERLRESILGRCEDCGHPDSWHHEPTTRTAIFGLLKMEFEGGCGFIECGCSEFKGHSLLTGNDQ